MTEIKNAKITSTMLGVEDHGIFTAYVTVEGNGWGCGFGGYAMDYYSQSLKKRVSTAYGMAFIQRLLKAVGVEKWESLPGTYVRVETAGLGSGITRIGHITKDQWFDPEPLAEEFALERPAKE